MSHHLRKLQPGATRLYRFPALGQSGEEAQNQQEQFEYGYQQGLEQGHDEGYQTGYQQGLTSGLQEGESRGLQQGQTRGFAQGLAEGRAEFEKAMAPFAKLQEQWSALTQEKMQQQKALIAQLVEQVARRVIMAEFTLNPQQVLHQVEQALATLPADPEELVIYLNEGDRERLLEQGVTRCEGWPLQVDPALAVGDARIETRAAVVEVSTSTRLTACIEQVNSSLSVTQDA
ncbi:MULTISPECIES: lateral flagellar assembly protein FliH [Aeromonas]|uniref:Flagellar assembly protein FliH n=2 Tax=Aeromonas TaxID=642 RepID=A0A175VGY2_AEREN|nr:lateral flagellar assembly protein FliH [Aeromonas enteropelogenes]KXU79790.1 flagellar assembly protein FliH [Aeromonas enteropelogenes]MBL0521828.1 lateral flagellar assembly protein FliH [Aeromonas enteropelogenes]MCZ0752099.1 lateral flagellar assembly protein FliH [Aeromonas enteropelogenes]RQM62165.1 flagellar assembly protein FliH [Aeromonas enteropelogenes]UAK72045.1 lateral flagellar assembly protein FliH [Aeromonas enteropelogenes]